MMGAALRDPWAEMQHNDVEKITFCNSGIKDYC